MFQRLVDIVGRRSVTDYLGTVIEQAGEVVRLADADARLAPTAPLLEAAHALAGCGATLGVTELAASASAFEAAASSTMARRQRLDDDALARRLVDAIGASTSAMHAMRTDLQKTRQPASLAPTPTPA